MDAYKTQKVITEDGKIILSDLPYLPGRKVDVIVVPISEKGGIMLYREWEKLFKALRLKDASITMSENDIIREIDAQRSGK